MANNCEISNDHLKLLMASFLTNIYHNLYDGNMQEDTPTLHGGKDIVEYIGSLMDSETYKQIHDEIKKEQFFTKEEFIERMNNVFQKNSWKKNQQQYNQNLNINNSINNSNKEDNNNKLNAINNSEDNGNGCIDKCITGLGDCWASVKSDLCC